MADRKYDVVAIMSVPVDLVLKMVDNDWPAVGKNGLVEYIGHLPGGPPANMVSAASHLGLKAAHVAIVPAGDDATRVLTEFEKHGVSTEFIQVKEGVFHSFTVVVIFPNGERSILVPRVNWLGYDPEVAHRALAQSRYFTTMPNNLDAFLDLARAARAAGTGVLADIDRGTLKEPERLNELVSACTIVSFNQYGFETYLGVKPTYETMSPLLDLGPEVVVVTRAGEGSIAVTRDEQAEVPGYRVNVVDTTGAGDNFNAGFLTATLRGFPLKERLRFANAAAAIKVGKLGPRSSAENYDEVIRFMADHSGG
ncbi:MAG: carbohydrate kinase family protein [Anaerolineae bacterium]|nr:carbohydrate kinase family protein [Anaerolineae bacterium]